MGKRSPDDPSKSSASGNTKVQQDGERSPRLPHEHDESSDSQPPEDGQPSKVGRQAYTDVKRGLVDTDRGPVFEEMKKKHFNAAPEEDEDADPVG